MRVGAKVAYLNMSFSCRAYPTALMTDWFRHGDPDSHCPALSVPYAVDLPGNEKHKRVPSTAKAPVINGLSWEDRCQPLVCSSAADLLLSFRPSKRLSNSSSAFSSLPLKFPAACRRLMVSC